MHSLSLSLGHAAGGTRVTGSAAPQRARRPLILRLSVPALVFLAMFGATSPGFACVVGTAPTASCTEAALDACLPSGGSFDGTVTFDCGGAATIAVTTVAGPPPL